MNPQLLLAAVESRLAEYRETIRSQAAEIAFLREQLSKYIEQVQDGPAKPQPPEPLGDMLSGLKLGGSAPWFRPRTRSHT